MNENCKHSLLSAFIEDLRKKKKITIAALASEARISTKTYNHIKKGLDVRFSAYESLFFYYLEGLSEEKIRQTINGWVEEWLKTRSRDNCPERA